MRIRPKTATRLSELFTALDPSISVQDLIRHPKGGGSQDGAPTD